MFGHPSQRDPAHGLDPADLAELAEVDVRVAAEYAVTAPAVLTANLARLLQRRVPVLGVQRLEDPDASFHLCFADGTALVVVARHHGDLGWAAVSALRHQLRLLGYRREPATVWVELGDGHHSVVLQATGLDR